MSKIRIINGHHYVLAKHPGISGFQDWSRKVESVVTSLKARHNRVYIDREYIADGCSMFRVADGHLPEHQPIMSEADALRWLQDNPFQEIVRISP